MNLSDINNGSISDLWAAFEKCCGAHHWVEQMVITRPFVSREQLFEKAEQIWEQCSDEDWLEAFEHHPKIGDVSSLKKKFANTEKWAGQEQAGVNVASDEIIRKLAEGNREYEQKFGYIFIVCATGKSAAEMLALLEARLHNAPGKELRIAMREQMKITRIRLEKLLGDG